MNHKHIAAIIGLSCIALPSLAFAQVKQNTLSTPVPKKTAPAKAIVITPEQQEKNSKERIVNALKAAESNLDSLKLNTELIAKRAALLKGAGADISTILIALEKSNATILEAKTLLADMNNSVSIFKRADMETGKKLQENIKKVKNLAQDIKGSSRDALAKLSAIKVTPPTIVPPKEVAK